MTFPPHIQFEFPWRNYQQVVLDDLDLHMEDDALHVVAPPGSGKTILGLEVMRRLDQPALVLAPSLAIRNQWEQRWKDHFLGGDASISTSNDLRHPATVTFSTYQLLHTTYVAGMEEFKATGKHPVLEGLRAAGVRTLVVDEAHHLKNAWWRPLNLVREELNVRVVGLTATPPFDVSGAEWKRYIALNGPIDAEIAVPELVSTGTLCPHQDLIHFSLPSEDETQGRRNYHARAVALLESVPRDFEWGGRLRGFSWFARTERFLDDIYGDLEAFAALIVLAKASELPITEFQLDVLELKLSQVPDLDLFWLERALNVLLSCTEDDRDFDLKFQEKQAGRLKQQGLVERGKVRLLGKDALDRSLRSSKSKLTSVKDITRLEYANMGDALRLVILLDFIRPELLEQQTPESVALERLGVVPVFELLRREALEGLQLGVLTGSIVILPEVAANALEAEFDQADADRPQSKPLKHDAAYRVFTVNDAFRERMVTAFTDLLNSGVLHGLVGTRALLGEGWDAPSVNTLILASGVGSFVSSNQMRGRAIRTNPNSPEKASNIWHLCCLDPDAPDGGSDLEKLRQRFDTFVGISNTEIPQISSGLERLDITTPRALTEEWQAYNADFEAQAQQRTEVRNTWTAALESGNILVSSIVLNHPLPPAEYAQRKSFLSRNSTKWAIRFALSFMLFAVMEFGGHIFRVSEYFESAERRWLVVKVCFVLLVLGVGIQFARTFWARIRFRDIEKDFVGVSHALFEAIQEAELFDRKGEELVLHAATTPGGVMYCALEGGTRYDAELYTETLYELLSAPDNPRFLIVRYASNSHNFRRDYHPVPVLLGKTNTLAKSLFSKWRKHVGRAKLVYTRDPEGRKLLLKARMHNLSRMLDDDPPPRKTRRWA